MYGSFRFGLIVCVSGGLDNEYTVMAINDNVMMFIKSFTNIPAVFFALILVGIIKWCTVN